MTHAPRDVLLGANPPVTLSRRASSALERIRQERALDVDPVGLVLDVSSVAGTWWTFAGTTVNASLASGLRAQGLDVQFNAESIHGDHLDRSAITAIDRWSEGALLSDVDAAAVDGLKFSAALPQSLAVATLQERLSDVEGARDVCDQPLVLRQAE